MHEGRNKTWIWLLNPPGTDECGLVSSNRITNLIITPQHENLENMFLIEEENAKEKKPTYH